MLDFAILISLYYYQLFFITRLIPDAQKPLSKENHQRPLDRNEIEAIRNDKWSKVAMQEFGKVLERLNELKINQEKKHSITRRIDNRKGLARIPWQLLNQYQSYLKGFFFHSINKPQEALRWYNDSLYVSNSQSVNLLRLHALEGIELIISQNQEKQKRAK